MPPGRHATESNAFGIHEFMRLCRLVGRRAVPRRERRLGGPQEFHDWVSYCNAPPGTLSLADERAANGDKEPFNVKYWGVGNESWGCGGNMTGGEYATEYRKYISQVPTYLRPFFVATGPRGHSADGDVGWTEGFFAGDCRTYAAWASASTASPCTTTPTSVRPPRTGRSSTKRAGTPSCTRASASRR